MIDNLNAPTGVFLESRSEDLTNSDVKYLITSGFTGLQPWPIEIIVPENSEMPISVVDANVPKKSIEEIRQSCLSGSSFPNGASLLENGYAKQNSHLTWVIESELTSCSENDLALIVFMVHEWFFLASNLII